MSNTQITLLITIGVVVAILLIVLVAVPELKKKNVNVEKIVKALETKGEIVEKAADELRPMLPKKAITILDILEKWCPIGAGYAEQLAHTGDIDKDDRAAAAEDVVLDVLKELDIDVTDRRRSLIKAAIENAVNDLGHEVPVGKLSYEVDVKPSKAAKQLANLSSTTNMPCSNEDTQIKIGEVKKDENGNVVSVDTNGKETTTQVKAESASNAGAAISNVQIGQSNGEAEKVVAQETETPKTVEERVSTLENQLNEISTNITNIAAAVNTTAK